MRPVVISKTEIFNRKQSIIVGNKVVFIPLTKSLWARTDRESYERLEALRENLWQVSFNRVDNKWYANGKNKDKTSISMHRLVSGCPSGSVVNHKNFNTLDNRSENLEICSNQQNGMYSRKKKNGKHSKYKGVTFHKGKWRATIGLDYKVKFLGYFATEVEAAVAYNDAAVSLYGKFALLNVIQHEIS